MTVRDTSARAAALLACLAAGLALAACASRGGLPGDAVPAAQAGPVPADADAEPLADGIVPLTLEQEREVE